MSMMCNCLGSKSGHDKGCPLAVRAPECEYYHDLHCNATRYKPMGCDMCSCTMYYRAKNAERKVVALQARITELEKA